MQQLKRRGWSRLGGSVLGLAAAVASAAPAPAARDPAGLTEVRAVFREVQELRARRALRRVPLCTGREFTEASLARDAAGTIRLFEYDTGGDDSRVRVSAYYDAQERLRFVLMRAGAVNDSEAERRFYYRADGRLLVQRQRPVRGLGYPWDWAALEREVIGRWGRAPRQALRAWRCGRRP
ncbi:MAG: hypothetical protein IPG96_01815 [Proteobacteria bacterium]|nr:hypothetical protein [Pseudomonadota bacterium]